MEEKWQQKVSLFVYQKNFNIFIIFVKLVGGYKLGKVIIEGKTKQVYDLPNEKGLCILLSKDRITAGDGARAHDLAGKAEISNKTNGQVFGILNAAGKIEFLGDNFYYVEIYS